MSNSSNKVLFLKVNFLKTTSHRACRLGIDLVHDDVERNLLKEREVIRGAESLSGRVLKETLEQIRKLKATLYHIDRDLKDKESNLHIDRRNVTLKETDFNLSIHQGTLHLDKSYVVRRYCNLHTLSLEYSFKILNCRSYTAL